MKMKRTGGRNKIKFKFKLGWKDLLLYGFLFIFLIFISAGIGNINTTDAPKTVPISTVVQDVKADKVKEIQVNDKSINVVYKDGKKVETKKEPNASIYEVLKNAGVDPNKVKIEIKGESSVDGWISILINFLPVVLIIGFFYFIFRQARGAQENVFSFGSQKGKTFNKDFPKVTFADVAGVEEAKQELSEIVDFLKNPQKYTAMGARTPKGVLMVGPSGTGKTLLARAVAGEAKVPFISIAGSEFMEMLVGVGAARVRDLFATAKKTQPAIIFIDEVDAIGRQRGGAGLMGGHDEREQTLNQILVEMDGFTPNEQLVVIAATNRPDILDSALVRPGRFDRTVALQLPDIEGRKEILKIHAKNKPFSKDADWEKVARRTVGFSGADLENMLNESAIRAARLGKKAIDFSDIEESATRVKMGPEKKRLQSEEDKNITAFHEAGHAIVSYFLPHTDPVHRISIVSRGLSLGHTLIPPIQDRVHETKSRLLEQVSTMLGGRAAEELVFDEMTTGASNDIEKATEVVRHMVVDFGMSSLGPVSYELGERERMFGGSQTSDDMQAKIDQEVRSIISERYKKAQEILVKNRVKLNAVAKALVDKETLEGDEFDSIMKNKKKNNKKTQK